MATRADLPSTTRLSLCWSDCIQHLGEVNLEKSDEGAVRVKHGEAVLCSMP